MDLLQENIAQIITQITGVLPNILGAVILLILGWLVAKVLKSVASRLLKLVGLHSFAERTKVDETLEGAGISATLSDIVANAIYWIVMLLFVTAATNTLGLAIVAETINSFMAYIPNVVAALFIIIITVTIARFVRDISSASLKQFGIVYNNAIASFLGGVILAFGLLTAITQLNIDISLLTDNFTILLIGVVATVGTTFALGSRNTVANLIAGYYVQRTMKAGDEITLAGIFGTVKEINATSIILETEKGMKIIPNDKAINVGS